MRKVEKGEEIQMNETNLKPCPFCGARARILQANDALFYISCTGCDARTDFDTREEVIETWNRRYRTMTRIEDELWVYGDWENSYGCTLEVKRAKSLNIPIRYFNNA